ncbi:MAG: hypothetical protein WBB28_09470 [Crinalium sp.]
MLYRPLQFLTLLEAYASLFSILTYASSFLPADLCLVLVGVIVVVTIGGWTYWHYSQQNAIHTKVCLLAIAIGSLLGTWL